MGEAAARRWRVPPSTVVATAATRGSGEVAGDNFQKPPPASKGWYRELVETACINSAQASLADGPFSAAGRGLSMLKAARRVVLTRLMRAEGDKPFIEAQQHVRRTDVGQAVTDEFVAGLRTVSPADLLQDETW